jgi:hypothetical protein
MQAFTEKLFLVALTNDIAGDLLKCGLDRHILQYPCRNVEARRFITPKIEKPEKYCEAVGLFLGTALASYIIVETSGSQFRFLADKRVLLMKRIDDLVQGKIGVDTSVIHVLHMPISFCVIGMLERVGLSVEFQRQQVELVA